METEPDTNNRKLVRYVWEYLNLSCEWQGCQEEYPSMNDFLSHIKEDHLTSSTELDLHCQWRDCEYINKSVPELRRHVLYHAFHTKIKNYGKNFQLRKKLPECGMGNHNRNVLPELPEPFVCSWGDCTTVFESPEKYYLHVENHTLECCYSESTSRNKGPISCHWARCKRKFSNQYNLKDHAKSHTQEKLIACPACGSMFASRTKFEDHLMRQKVVDKTNAYVCEYCSVMFSTERLLRDHMQNHVNHYKCPCCDMTCPNPSSLRVHIDYRHSDVKQFSCQYCEYRCKKRSDLRKHLVTHSADPPFVCSEEGCNFTSRSQTGFRDHHSTVHQEIERPNYACHMCSKITTRGHYLTQHLISKHNFSWPSGHYRFRYHQEDDGYFRLQTVRYESSELSEVILCDTQEKIDDPDHPEPGYVNSLSSNIIMQGTTESVSLNSPTEGVNEEQTLTSNPSLVGVPMLMYVQNDGSEQVAAVISNNASEGGTPAQIENATPQNSVVFQLVDSDGNPVAFPENSFVLSHSVESLPGFANSQTVSIQDKDGLQYETAHIIASGPTA